MDSVNELNRKFTQDFTQAMNAIKPTNRKDPDYAKNMRAWQHVFAFTKELQNKVNDLNNKTVLKGKPNTSN